MCVLPGTRSSHGELCATRLSSDSGDNFDVRQFEVPENAVPRSAAGLPSEHCRVEDFEWFEAFFFVPDTRTVHKHGLIKPEGNKYRAKATHGTVIAVRYNPFDLSVVWRYDGDTCVETLSAYTLNHPVADRLPEERGTPAPEVSLAASQYFTRHRERQATIRNAETAPNCSRLSEEGLS